MEGKRHARPTHLSSRAPVIADPSESTIGIESSVGMETSSLWIVTVRERVLKT